MHQGKSRSRYRETEVFTSLGFLLPTATGLFLFSLLPLVLSFVDSFSNYGFYQKRVFVGFDNYFKVFDDRYFLNSILVGLQFTIIVVPVQLVGAFLFANLLKELKGSVASFVKTAIVIPTVISGVAASLIFVFIFDYQGGVLNNVLHAFGVPLQAWFEDKGLALFSISAPRIWLGFGYATLFMLGGLLDIPESYYEAAKLDGANTWMQISRITLPSMRNVILFLFVSGIVSAMQEFDLPYNMTGGGPARATETPALFTYTHFIRDSTIGFSLASAMIIAAVLGVISAFVFRIVSSEKSYE